MGMVGIEVEKRIADAVSVELNGWFLLTRKLGELKGRAAGAARVVGAFNVVAPGTMVGRVPGGRLIWGTTGEDDVLHVVL
jgi:hypothetical protein